MAGLSAAAMMARETRTASSAAPPGAGSGVSDAEGAVGRQDAFGTKTLAQIRHEAAQQRKDILISMMPGRGQRLAELFYLLKDREDVSRFGAGLDSTPSIANLNKALVQDQNTDKKLGDFTSKWMQTPNVAALIQNNLPSMKATPPPSPIRRDSHIIDVSEEVAALERELTKPEYRSQAGVEGERLPQDGSSVPKPEGISVDTEMANANGADNAEAASAQVKETTITKPPAPQSLQSPYPVTFRSPSFLKAGAVPPQVQDDSEPAAPLTIDPSQLQIISSAEVKAEQAEEKKPTTLQLRSFPEPFSAKLEPLPEGVIKNRLAVGGLARQKARERTSQAQQGSQAGTASAASSDLYKLGISKATHSGVRSLMGATAPQAGKTRLGGKVLLTSDWQVAVHELQSLRAMERIEQLKSEKTWSMRQLRKQRAPGTQKAHWDYMLEEMKWMATDFRQETRWKQATAFDMAQDVKAWHDASPEERQTLQIKARPPTFLPIPGQDGGEGEVTQTSQMEEETVPETLEEAAIAADLSSAEVVQEQNGMEVDSGDAAQKKTDEVEKDADETPAISGNATRPSRTPAPAEPKSLPTPSGVTSELPSQGSAKAPNGASQSDAPRTKKHQHALLRARAPVFELPASATVFDLSGITLPGDYKKVTTSDTVSELFQELPAYGPPMEPSADPRQNRRLDESSPNYAKITNPSHLLESKPILVSTLNPSRKRKQSGGWADLSDLTNDDNRDGMSDVLGGAQDIVFGQGVVRPKDTGNKRFNPAPPANAEARSASFDWSAEEDRQLFIFTRQYSFNWDLVAHVFNAATKRGKSDERLPWDCFDRWHKKFAPPPTGTIPLPPTPLGGQTQLAAAGRVPPEQQPQVPLQQQPGTAVPTPPAGASAPLPMVAGQPPMLGKKDRRVSSTMPPAGPAATVTIPPGAVKKQAFSRSQMRHNAMLEATKEAQRRREILQKKAAIGSAIRKVNLSAHETHNQPIQPNLTALDLSKLKFERERQQVADMAKREQARQYQQAQAQAMAQQQAQRGQQGIPSVPGQAPRMPQQPLNPQQQAQQAAIMAVAAAQRAGSIPGQLPAGVRPPSQAGQPINRPPSQAGSQSSPQMQHPNIPHGMNMPPMPMPMQQQQQNGVPRHGSPSLPPMPAPQPSQSPQGQGQMQLSPSQQAPQVLPGQGQNMSAQQQAFLASQLAAIRAASPQMQAQLAQQFQVVHQAQQAHQQHQHQQQQQHHHQQQQQQQAQMSNLPPALQNLQNLPYEQQQNLIAFMRSKMGNQANQGQGQG